jgi:hypothetical protein
VDRYRVFWGHSAIYDWPESAENRYYIPRIPPLYDSRFVPWTPHRLTVGIVIHFLKLIEERVIDFVDDARLDAKLGSLEHRYQLLSVHQFDRMMPLSARPIMAFLKSPTAARDTEPLYFLH